MIAPRCPGHGRHWFTMQAKQAGGTGVRTPRCTRCGAANPKSDLTSDDWTELYALGWQGLTAAEREWIARKADGALAGVVPPEQAT